MSRQGICRGVWYLGSKVCVVRITKTQERNDTEEPVLSDTKAMDMSDGTLGPEPIGQLKKRKVLKQTTAQVRTSGC